MIATKARKPGPLLPALILCALALPACRTYTKDLATLSPEQAREDVDHLVRNFKAMHVEPWHTVTEKQFKEEAEAIKNNLPDPISRKELAIRLARLVAMVGDSHTRLKWWRSFEEYVDTGGGIFPLKVRSNGDGGLAVEKVSDQLPDTSIEPDHKLLAVNGQPVEDLLAECRPYIAGPNPRFRNLILTETFRFNAMIWHLWDPAERFHVRLRDEEGNTYGELLSAVSNDADKVEGDGEDDDKEERFRYAFYREGRVCVLKVNSFSDESRVETDIDERFEAFLDEMFAAMNERGTGALIVDVRRNGGGKKGLVEDLLRRVADKPFRDHALRWRYSATLEANALVYYLNKKGVPACLMLDRMLALDDLGIDQPEPDRADGEFKKADPETIEPDEDAWDGRLVVAAGRGTYSAAVNLAALVKDNDLGLVVGQETAGTATKYGQSVPILLPNSGLIASVAVAHMTRPAGHDDGRGVVPDHALPYGLSDKELVDRALPLLKKEQKQHARRGERRE